MLMMQAAEAAVAAAATGMKERWDSFVHKGHI
jgi:hypothetical protein